MAVAAEAERVPGRPVGSRGPALALFKRALLDARVRTIAFAYLFAIASYLNPTGYRAAYPTQAARIGFAHSFGANKAVVLFYGKAYDLLTVGGYSAWRTGGILAILAGVFGVLAAVRALRAEEDSGRAELVLSGPVGRNTVLGWSGAAIVAGAGLLWLACLIGSLIGGLPAGSSAYLALAIVSMIPVFAGVGAVASQIAPTRRLALELGSGVIAASLLLRVIADTSTSVSWLRWLTPLGWAEQLRPFTGARPLVLALPLVASCVLLVIAQRLALRRDIGTGLLAASDSSPPRLGLLSSTTAQTLREQRGSLAVWAVSVGAFAFLIGVISNSISSAGISKGLQQELDKIGSGSITTPKGYVGFAFSFFVLAISFFPCAQIAAARAEEASQRLETVFSQSVGRRSWLIGRIALAAGGTVGLAFIAALLSWLGAVSQGVSLSLGAALEAGLNCLPVGALFLGLAALAYALIPRASAGIAYGLVTASFLWQIAGSLLGAPKLLVELTPFAHVASVPAQPFKVAGALIMVAIGVVCAAGATALFARRDLTGP